MVLDLLAYSVLAAIYFFGGVPILGSMFSNDRWSTYRDDMKIGVVIHVVLAVLVAFIALAEWATDRVLY